MLSHFKASQISTLLYSSLLSSYRIVQKVCGLVITILLACALSPPTLHAQPKEKLKVRFSIGYNSQERKAFEVRLIASGGVTVDDAKIWSGSADNAHVMTRTFLLEYPKVEVRPIQNLHSIWADLVAHSDADTVSRLSQDAAWRPDTRRLTVQLNSEGTKGFSVTVDQLIDGKTFWLPSLDVYITVGDIPVSFLDYQNQRASYSTLRILDQVQRAPESTYNDFKNKWEDMGNPIYANPGQKGPGHIIGLSWDSAVSKFGIDRGAGVQNDYGNPERFRFWFGFSNLYEGITSYWKSQSLSEGLPIVTTIVERDAVRYEVEQFAYPLNGNEERQDEKDMVLLQRVRMTDLSGHARILPVTMSHERKLSTDDEPNIIAEQKNGRLLLEEGAHHNILLEINAGEADVKWAGVVGENMLEAKRANVTLSVSLPANGSREFYVTLPTPAIPPYKHNDLNHINYDAARSRTIDFWSSYLARGASFQVPEQDVNDLFRANLWHALTLPRLHADGRLDLPYTNFGYSQTGTPWPVNQAVYVDYMLYGLRGYDNIATEELRAIFKNNQRFDGSMDGAAHWLVYTPGMLYAVAQNYLLSGDRKNFDKLLPETLKALDWSLTQIRDASTRADTTQGLVAGSLNDLTGSGYWAFNQAYLYAGVELMGKALERAGNPRSAECLSVAKEYRKVIIRAMSKASVQSPLVQLRDHTWVPYIPSNVSIPGRNLDKWYPTDVDVGATHLLRLNALPAQGVLAESLLNDHEDNLFLHGWGVENEPVYNQQATVYLIRDDVKAVIRAFYSLMAAGFSHSVYEPVEHRWLWGQYFGPPSTDGAWFELYRNMLVREVDDHTLLLAQAVPRVWLEDGKTITVKNAPTWLGKISFEVQSHADSGTISASLQLNNHQPGTSVLLRLRHPQNKLLRQVTVNGKTWQDFDAQKEWVKLPNVSGEMYSIVATY